METQIWQPACSCMWKFQQRNNSHCQHFCLEKADPLNLAPSPDNSVSCHMSLGPYFELLPQHWCSDQLSLHKVMHKPFKRNAWDSSNPFSFSYSPCWFSQSGVVETSLSDTLFLAGESSVGLWLLASQEWPLQLRYPSQSLTTTHGCGASLFQVFDSSYQSWHAFFFIALDIGLILSYISGGSEW